MSEWLAVYMYHWVYVCRQDVIKVISSFDAKSVEASIVVMRKRLDKHFASPEMLVCIYI